MDKLAWVVPLMPLAGFLVNAFLGRRMPRPVTGFVACGTVAVSALVSWLLFFHVRSEHAALVSTSIDWIKVDGISGAFGVLAPFRLYVDELTCVMILIVTNIGFLIHVYSTGYMSEEKRYSRYFAYLNLFTSFMLMLVMASNVLLMFVGWEGVGLCSYLLIGFWYEKRENAAAGMKAFIVNRIGDFAFVVGFLLLFTELGLQCGTWTVEFAEMKAVIGRSFLQGSALLTVVGILFFIGATGKSAQIPLFVWLPDAMAGPTPVSALIHAATMVTAGVYMIARLNFIYSLAPAALSVVAVVGACTALFAGTIGLAQNDIKKVLAYSTVSQLGFMFLGVGVGAYAAGIFHLLTHACFKACLFLGSGSVIHGMGGEQDIRKMGGLKKYMPVTFVTFVVASVAIAGLPPLAGFFSKDEILWKAWSAHSILVPGPLLWFMGAVAAVLTAFYMTRLCIMTFWGDLRSTPAAHHGDDHAGAAHDSPAPHDADDHGHAAAPAAPPKEHHAGTPHESPTSMTVPLIVLAGLSCLVGFLGIPHMNAFEHWLEGVCPEAPAAIRKVEGAAGTPAPAGEHHPGGAMEWVLMAASVALASGSIAYGVHVYLVKKGEPARAFAEAHRELHALVRDKYRVDELYQEIMVEPILALNESLGRFDTKVIDGAVNGSASGGAATALATGWVDNEVVDGGVNATGRAAQFAGRGLRRLQTGNIRSYVTGAVVGGLLLIASYCMYLILQRGWGDIHRFIFSR